MMKKHPLIRSLHYDKLPQIEKKYPRIQIDKIEAMTNKETRQFGKNNRIVVVTENKEYIPTFIFDNSGTPVHIAIPDMPLVYLRLAYVNLKSLKETKAELFRVGIKPETSLENAYNYIGAATISLVNIYTSVESFINQLIPQEIKYPTKKGRYLDYKSVVHETTIDKLRYVLPFCFRKSLLTVDKNAYDYLTDKIKVRDEVVHLKYEMKIDDQVELFKKLLTIDYERLFNSVVTFFNLYRTDYAVECSCEKEF